MGRCGVASGAGRPRPSSPADRRLLIVLAEGVDGSAVRRLIDEGTLPCFARLMETGASGDLAPGSPSPMAGWGSMATGLPAHCHALIAPLSVREDGIGVTTPRASDWNAPPFWHALAAAGYEVALVNLAATARAADAGAAFVVDERFFALPEAGGADWPLARGSVHPAEHRDVLRDLRVHPDTIRTMDLGGLSAEVLAEAGSIHAVALHFLKETNAAVVVVRQSVGARMPGTATLRFLDRLLDAMLMAAGSEADLLLANPGGLVLMTGQTVASDSLLHGARPADVAATVLTRYGMTVAGGRSLDGCWPLQSPPPPLAPVFVTHSGEHAIVHTVRRDHALALAESAINDGDYRYAQRQLRALLADEPDQRDALLLLAQCSFMLEDWPSCLAIGSRLADLAPEQPWGIMAQGAGLLMTKHRAEAFPLLDLAAARAANDPVALCKLGALWMYASEPRMAHRHYERAAALRPDDPYALAGLGLALLAIGELASAERHLKASLARRFHAPTIHQQLALLYEHLGRDTDAAVSRAVAREQMASQDDVMRD